MDNQLLFDLAVAALAHGDLVEAERGFLELLALHPGNPQIRHPLGVTLAQQGRTGEALDLIGGALETNPDDLDILLDYGVVLREAGRFEEALAAFDHALTVQPGNTDLVKLKGDALMSLHRYDDAMACYDLVLSFTPNTAMLLHSRGNALRGLGITVTGAKPHIEGGARLSGPAINPVNAAAAAQSWRSNRPQIVVLDNRLTDEALAAMRRYCWGSAMWRDAYDPGYIGAFPEIGFSAPLLAQIVEEFRTVFSDICGDHALKYIWGFKYDSSLEGIGIHADAAAVNVNFWITPDGANLDPESGGLVVWDRAAPLDWDFAKFNRDEDAIRDFLAQSGAKSLTIPYRANRAVIFDSDLFHQTDTIRFKPGYYNRRINVTLLYGERDPGTPG